MFKSSNNRVSVDVETEQLRKSVSMLYEMDNRLNTTKKERTESLCVEAEKVEELPYLDLDFSEGNLVKAMVYSEIFGKPKSKRRKR